MNYFEFYSGDYSRDTADLTLIEHGAFLLLLSAYYATERPIPSDNPTLFRIARAMNHDEQQAVVKVADRFFPIDPTDGLRHNTRADTEIVKARARIDSARENGRNGGRPRKPKQNPAGFNPVNPNETQPLTHKKALHAPCSIKDQEQERPPAAAEFDFKADLFARWKALPNGGGGAFLNKLFKDHKPEQRVIEAVERTLSDTRSDPKAFVIGALKAKPEIRTPLDDDSCERALAAQDFTGVLGWTV